MTTDYTHRQAFWTVKFPSDDVSDDKHRKLVRAAAALRKQKGVLIALSASGRTIEEPEITLVVNSNVEIESLTSAVTLAVTEQIQGVKPEDVTLQEEIRCHAFNEDHLTHIEQYTTSNGLPENSGIPSIVVTGGNDGAGITHRDFTFSILESRWRLLVNNDSSLRNELESLRKMFRELAVETKTSAAVVLMAREGVVTIGTQMWNYFVRITSSNPSRSNYLKAGDASGLGSFHNGENVAVTVVTTINSTGGLPNLVDSVPDLQGLLASADTSNSSTAFPMSRSFSNALPTSRSSNILLLINEQSAPLALTGQSVLPGSNGVVVDHIGPPHQWPQFKIYSSGLYLSFLSSLSSEVPTEPTPESGLGVSLRANLNDTPGGFSVGVYAGLRSNSVRVINGEDAQRARDEARDTINATDQVVVGSTQKYIAYGRRQDADGPTNYVLGRFYPSDE